MELVFKRSEQEFAGNPAYEVEFNAAADFNLHIERPSEGRLLVFQKSVQNGSYSLVDSVSYYQDDKPVLDIDFVGAVYPKWIKIVSEVEPTMAVATSDGEITVVEEKEKFSIRIYTWNTSGSGVIPTDTVAEYEIPKKDATWQDVASVNADFLIIDSTSAVFWKNDYMVSSGYVGTNKLGEVSSSDKVIADYEYSALGE